MTGANMAGGAVFDKSGRYRYSLWRDWDEKLPRLAMLMLNPSTADAVKNDATISRCVTLAANNGFGRVEAVNLFAYRATEPSVLKKARSPVGKLNDEHIAVAAKAADIVLLAWGNHGTHLQRSDRVVCMLKELKIEMRCLGVTKLGEPRHPLYVRSDAPFFIYSPPVDR